MTNPTASSPVGSLPPDLAGAVASTSDGASRGIEAPRAPRRRVRTGSNFEMYSWLFMRLSGIVLVVLVLGHLLIMNVLDGGVHRINWGFVAGRWASPFWQIWDLAMLWLAELHGANGLRVIINDYSRRPGTRFWLQVLLAVSVVLTVGLGSFVIFTFDPSMGS
jgi:succinate dehydrogenase / fumarate reductase membrane anchor subunit